MNAIHRAILHLCRLLLSALRKPCDWSLRHLLRLWASVNSYLLSRSGFPRPKKAGRSIDQDDHSKIVIFTSRVPPEISSVILQDTPTITLSSPTTIRVTSYLSPPHDLPSRNTHGSSQILDDEGDEDHGFERPRVSSRASSRAPSSYQNSHSGAEEAAIRSLRAQSYTISSRPVSPVSRRSSLSYESPTGTDNSSIHRFQRHSQCFSIPSTVPRSPAHDPVTNLRAHTMIDLHPRNYPVITSQSRSRSRPSSVRSSSRASSQSPRDWDMGSSDDLREVARVSSMDPSPAHRSASPASPPENVAYVPEPIPCTTVARYERNIKIKDTSMTPAIPSLTTIYSLEDLPRDWRAIVHPEGARSWVNEQRPIYTDADLCDPKILCEVNEFLRVMMRLIDESDRMPKNWELVLELSNDIETERRIWSYYFVDEENRALFWLHPCEVENMLNGISGVSKAHIHHQIESYYWTHWELFPHNREVPSAVHDELMGILFHAQVDSLTSLVSTSIYSQEELSKLSGVFASLKDISGNRGHAACITGRLMAFFAHSRFINFYGQHCARLCRDQSLYEDGPIKPPPIFVFLSAFLFFGPEGHLRGLESIYTDEVLYQHMWARFIAKLKQEWEELTLSATVLLTANVSFLAIPSVDSNVHIRSPSQIVSYLSVLTSIGSIIAGLLLVRQHRNKDESAEEVDVFLKNRSHGCGFEALAVVYSLPYSLLMWAMITFLAAFTLEAVVKPTTLVARIPVACALVIVGTLIMWCAIVRWEWENPVRSIGPLFSWVNRLLRKGERRSAEESSGARRSKNPWKLNRLIPRRLSTRDSAPDEPPIEMTARPSSRVDSCAA